MTEDQIEHMVQRFLQWRLPEDFRPDAGISFKAEFNEHTAYPMRHKPVGTNLLTAAQATAMVRHMAVDLRQRLHTIPARQHSDGATEALRAALEDARENEKNEHDSVLLPRLMKAVRAYLDDNCTPSSPLAATPQTLKPCEKHPERYCNCEGYPACREGAAPSTSDGPPRPSKLPDHTPVA